jgi:hypothetical protein
MQSSQSFKKLGIRDLATKKINIVQLEGTVSCALLQRMVTYQLLIEELTGHLR